MFQFQPEKARWFSEPRRYEIQPDRVIITTDPGSDFGRGLITDFRTTTPMYC